MIKDTMQKLLGNGHIVICTTGFQYLREGRYKEAIGYFDQAIAEQPKYVDAHLGKGKCLIRLGFHEVALQCYDTVLSLDPKNSEAFFQKGLCHVHLGAISDALKEFDLALELNAHNDAAWDNKAVCYQLLGDRTKVEQCITIGMQIRGEHPVYQPLLGRWYQSR